MEQQFAKAEVPFFTGRLVGLRSFSLASGNKLAGVTYTAPWDDGENVAKCAKYRSDFYGDLKTVEIGTPDEPASHSLAALNCSCGFYAYFDGNSNDFQQGVNVEGIVEAWGKLTIGEKGFRASKARIAALVIPKAVYPQTWHEKLLHRATCSASWRDAHGWSYPYLSEKSGCDLPLFPYPSVMDEIIANYPSAKIFNTMAEAQAAFPLTPVEVANEIVKS